MYSIKKPFCLLLTEKGSIKKNSNSSNTFSLNIGMNSTTGDGGAILTLVLTGVPGVGVLGGIEGGSLLATWMK